MARSNTTQQCAHCGRTTPFRLSRGLCTSCVSRNDRYGTIEIANDPIAMLTTRPTLTDADHTWWDEARCDGMPTRLFFPGLGESTSEAKEVCRGCPVRERCLEYALANGEKFGIWGGRSEAERKELRKLRRRGIEAA